MAVVVKYPACRGRRCRRRGFHPWVGKMPWRRKGQPTPVLLPGESPWTEEPGRATGSQRAGCNSEVTFAGLEGMTELLSEPPSKLLPASHAWVSQLREKEVWPPQPLTQSSSAFTLEGTYRYTQLPRGKRRSREVQDLPEVTQSWGC